MITVRSAGLEAILLTLNTADRKVIEGADRVTGRHVERLSKEAGQEKYPPELPRQTYIRTGKLGRSFDAKRIELGEFALRNLADYASYVIGEGRQARIHRGRWWVLQEIERRRRAELLRNLNSMADRVLNVN